MQDIVDTIATDNILTSKFKVTLPYTKTTHSAGESALGDISYRLCLLMKPSGA